MIRICAMKNEHLPDVERLQAAAYADPCLVEPIDVHRDRLSVSPDTCFVAVDPNEQVVGYLVTHLWTKGSWPGLNITSLCLDGIHCDALHVHDIAVARGQGGQRIAPRLLEAAFEAARARGIHHSNLVAVDGAHTFWARHGYVACENNRPPYGDDAWFMTRDI